jgi:hypothetical protein
LTAGALVLAAVAVTSVLLGETTRGTVCGATAVVATVVFLAFMVPQIHGSLSFLNGERSMYRGLSAENARVKCLVDGGNSGQVDFLEFVRREVPGKSRVVVVGPMPVDAACLSFVLLPRLVEPGPGKPSWAIFTSGVPSAWTPAVVPSSARTFKPGQLVARLRQ